MKWQLVLDQMYANIQRDANTARDALIMRRDMAEVMKLQIGNHVMTRIADALAVGVGLQPIDPIPTKTRRNKANRGD